MSRQLSNCKKVRRAGDHKSMSSKTILLGLIFATADTAGEGALKSCKKSDIFCEIDKGAVGLFDSRLQLAEETFCKIPSDYRGERDMESDEIGENHEIPPDSEEEGDLAGLTTIWSRRRLVRPPRHMEDFF